MSELRFNFEDSPQLPPSRGAADLIAFLNTPLGLECLADGLREARQLIGADAVPGQLEAMREFENELLAASARPLPSWLAL